MSIEPVDHNWLPKCTGSSNGRHCQSCTRKQEVCCLCDQPVPPKQIDVPYHLANCGHCSALYRLLVRAYSSDHGASFDADPDQELLCDSCGMTACAGGCKCRDVLCPHGRNHLRYSPV